MLTLKDFILNRIMCSYLNTLFANYQNFRKLQLASFTWKTSVQFTTQFNGEKWLRRENLRGVELVENRRNWLYPDRCNTPSTSPL